MCWLRATVLLVGVALGITGAWWAGWLAPIEADDVQQPRLDTALPLLPEGAIAQQELLPQHDGLSRVEVQLARWRDTPAEGTLTLRLRDDQGELVSEQSWATERLSHNQFLALTFPPQPDSASQRYTLELETNDGPFSLWGTELDVRSGDFTATGVDTTVQELRYRTAYTLTNRGAAAALGRLVEEQGPLWLLALGLLPLPGVLFLLLRPCLAAHWDAVAWAAVALALGMALWPLLWAALSALGGRWSGTMLWAVLGLGWLAALGRGWQQRYWLPRVRAAHLLLVALLLAALAVRALAVRDLAFPPWVDSVRHALITAIMAAEGQVITDYRPWLPVDQFPYHWGFHVLPAMLTQLSARALPDVLLALGQLLNTLAVLAVYSAAWLMTKRRSVALLAAFLVAFPFLFPGYYLTWGRYTQLAGMVLLPVLTGLTWRLVRGHPVEQRLWVLVGLLASGLFLTHIRLFIYWLPFPLLLWLWSRRHTRALLAAGGLTALLVGWRAWQLWPREAGISQLVGSFSGYNAFPTGYFTAGWERLWIVLALLAIPLALWGVRWRWRGAALPLLLAAWVGLLFAALAGPRLGLPESWLVNLNSMAITLYFPLALSVSWLGDRLWRLSARGPVALSLGGWLLAGGFVGSALLFGVRQQVSILNPETILAQREDVAGLSWMEANLPADARVAVSSWQWLGGTWSTTDGGAWIVPLIARQSTTPPADYIYDTALAQQVDDFNQWASGVEDWAAPGVAEELQAQGVTHLYVGAKGGFLDPAELSRNPVLRLVFHGEGIWLFEVVADRR